VKIFVVSPGRCGTGFLASIFRTFTDIPSFHEPFPRGIGRVMEEVNTCAVSEETRKVLEAKIQIIKENSSDGWYLESSQTFIKTFVFDFIEVFDDLGCIYIHRNLYDIIRSYAKHTDFQIPEEWFLRPGWARNEIYFPCKDEWSWFDIVSFNWFEVKQRFLAFRKYFKWTKEIDFADISNPDTYYQIFRELGISPKFEITKEKLDSLWKNKSKDYPLLSEKIRENWNKKPQPGGFTSDYEWLQKEGVKYGINQRT